MSRQGARVTEEEFRAILARQAAPAAPPAPVKPKRQPRVRGAKRARYGHIAFDSQAELRFFEGLILRHRAGELAWFARQPRFLLDGPSEYVADFLLVYPDGRCEIVDVKGHLTEVSRLKQKQVRARYGVEVLNIPAGEVTGPT